MVETRAWEEPLYPEKRLQLASVAALKAELGYEELFDDVEAVGARIDSAGFVDGRLWLVEYKARIDGSIVRHAPNKGSSLESKISGTLGPLYSGADDHLSSLCNSAWNRQFAPTIAFIANSVSAPARHQLTLLHSELEDAWLFDLIVLQWDGSRHHCLLNLKTSAEISSSAFSQTTIEPLINRPNRTKPMTWHSAQARAKSIGLEDVFEGFVNAAKKHGIKFALQAHSLGGCLGNSSKLRVCGCYLDSSSLEKGLAIGLWRPAFDDTVAAIGSPAPKVGHLHFNRYLGSREEALAIFEALRKPAEV
jgi:hypothetical protein